MTDLNMFPKCWTMMMFFVCASIDISCAHKILLIPLPVTSPVREATALATRLKANNHSVFLVMPKSAPNLDDLKSKYDIIDYNIKYPDLFVQPPNWILTGCASAQRDFFRHTWEGLEPFCTNPLEDEEYFRKIESEKFDLAMVEADIQRCHMLILHKLRIPYVTMILNIEQWRWKAPVLPSFVPTMLLGTSSESMTLIERLINFHAMWDWIVKPGVRQFTNEFIQKYDPSITYEFLYGKSLLFFVNTDFVIDYPRPVMPNEILNGGLTTRPAAPLPEDLLEFADHASNGLILVSFGTMDTQSWEQSSLEKFLETYRALGEYRFVWRNAKEMTPNQADNLPTNVLVKNWIPQNDLLGHRNTRLIITHCGANTQFEAVYHGVPILCFPAWYDNFYNAKRIDYLGYGRSLDIKTFTSGQLVREIRELVQNNQTYRENMRKASAIFRGSRDTPLERTVWWVEYAIKHGGDRLRSHAHDM